MAEVVRAVQVLKIPVAYEDLTAAGLSAKMAELEQRMSDPEREAVGKYLDCMGWTTMNRGDMPGWQDPLGYEPDGIALRKAERLRGSYPQLSFAFRMAEELVRAQKGWDLQAEYGNDLNHLNLDAQLSKPVFDAVVSFTLPGLVASSQAE